MRRQTLYHDAGNIESISIVGRRPSNGTIHPSPPTHFGLIPSSIIDSLLDNPDDFRARAQAIDELKILILDTYDVTPILPHVGDLINFLGRLLDDDNFKVSSAAIGAISALVDRLPSHIASSYVQPLLTVIGRRLGDANGFIRQSVVRTTTKLMQVTSPARVLDGVCAFGLVHRNARVRQETLNLVIVALLTFPSSDFDLPRLARTVGPALVDRRPVRQAALECYAVLAQAMGPNHRPTLMPIVFDIEKSSCIDGELVAAVNARLVNRQLPKRDPTSGLVEYATYLSRGSAGSATADIEWILAAPSGHGSSAKSAVSDGVLSSRSILRCSSAAQDDSFNGGASSRLRRSARRGLSRLPWDSDSKLKDRGSTGNIHELSHENMLGDGGSTTKTNCVPPISNSRHSDPFAEDYGPFIDSCRPNNAQQQQESLDDSTARDEVSQSSRRLRRSASKRRIDRMFGATPSDDGISSRTGGGGQSALDFLDSACDSGGESSVLSYASSPYRDESASTFSASSHQLVNDRCRFIVGEFPSETSGFGSDTSPFRPASNSTGTGSEVSAGSASIVGQNFVADTAHPIMRKPAQPKTREKRRLSRAEPVNASSVISGDQDSSNVGKDDSRCNPSCDDILVGIHGKAMITVGQRPQQQQQQQQRDMSRNGCTAAESVRPEPKLSKATQDKLMRKAAKQHHDGKPPKQPPPQQQQPVDADDVQLDGSLQRHYKLFTDYETKRQQLETEIEQEKRRMAASAPSRPTGNNAGYVAFEVSVAENDQTPLKPPRPQSKKAPRQRSASASRSVRGDKMVDGDDPANLQPFKDPVGALTNALRQIAFPDEEWETKCSGINGIRRLAHHHPRVLASQLHGVAIAVTAEVQCLRSVVSQLAIKCLGELFQYLSKDMATELDHTVGVLLKKMADTNNFIRDDSLKALTSMIQNMPPQKALAVLVTAGASQRNAVLRNVTARLLSDVAESLGPGRVLSGVKDITEKILSTSAQFMLDGSPEARYYGQKILYNIMSHEDFEQMMTRHVAADTLRSIRDKLDSMKVKGLGEPPSETRRMERKGSSRTLGSTGSSDSSPCGSVPSSANLTRRRPRQGASAGGEEVAALVACLTAGDFRERCRGLELLRDLSASNPAAVSGNITQIFDRLVPCLKDANSKVNLLALNVLHDVIPCISSSMANVVSLTVTTVVTNLASSNRDISDAAAHVLDQFVECVDPLLLLPSFVSQAQSSNMRYKLEMIDRVTSLVPKLFAARSKLNQSALHHILPLVWSLLGPAPASAGGAGVALRTCTARLIGALHAEIGDVLIDAANNNASVSLRARQTLRQIVDTVA